MAKVLKIASPDIQDMVKEIVKEYGLDEYVKFQVMFSFLYL